MIAGWWNGVLLGGGGKISLIKCYRQIKLMRTELVIRFGNLEVTNDKSGFSRMVGHEHDLWKKENISPSRFTRCLGCKLALYFFVFKREGYLYSQCLEQYLVCSMCLMHIFF